jgi:AI-2 transport protein TqsA
VKEIVKGHNLKSMLTEKSMLATCAALFVVMAGIKIGSAIIIPFLLAIFIAIVSAPMVGLLEKVKVPKGVAVISTMSFILFVGTMIGQIVNSSLRGFTGNIPKYKEQLTENLQSIPFIGDVEILNFSLKEKVGSFEPDMMMSIGVGILQGLGDVLGYVFLILLASIFMLLEADTFKEKVKEISPNSDSGKYSKKIDSFIKSVKHYMAIKTVISLATGAIVAFSLWLVGLDYFMLWGLLAFLLNYIPNIGSAISAIPPVLLAFVQFGSGTALLVLGLFVAINTIIGSIIEPKFMGDGLGLSTLVIFISLILWGFLLGNVGMLLSIPLTMIVKIACDKNDKWHWLSVMLSDKVR